MAMPIRQFLRTDSLPATSAAILKTSEQLDISRIAIPFVMGEYMDFDYESPRSFGDQHAASFSHFIRSLDRNITDLFVCCDAGESRSPAIATAIRRWLGHNDQHIWSNCKFYPNMLCF